MSVHSIARNVVTV